jgi:hypothetical protein
MFNDKNLGNKNRTSHLSSALKANYNSGGISFSLRGYQHRQKGKAIVGLIFSALMFYILFSARHGFFPNITRGQSIFDLSLAQALPYFMYWVFLCILPFAFLSSYSTLFDYSYIEADSRKLQFRRYSFNFLKPLTTIDKSEIEQLYVFQHVHTHHDKKGFIKNYTYSYSLFLQTHDQRIHVLVKDTEKAICHHLEQELEKALLINNKKMPFEHSEELSHEKKVQMFEYYSQRIAEELRNKENN